jgi:hypothetical protein
VADRDTAYRKYMVTLATTNSALHFHSGIRRMRIPKLHGDSRLHVRCNLHVLELECNAGAQVEGKQQIRSEGGRWHAVAMVAVCPRPRESQCGTWRS